jgi:hypothetical protein
MGFAAHTTQLISPMRKVPAALRPPQQIISCFKLLIFNVSLKAFLSVERGGGLKLLNLHFCKNVVQKFCPIFLPLFEPD